MTQVLAIDPGCHESAYAWVDAETRRPIGVDKLANDDLRDMIHDFERLYFELPHVIAIEMVASYGMAVGADVFETCVWIGRFVERVDGKAELVYRRDIKLHHCGSTKAKDANITQALIDRFAPSQPNRGKGTKTAPGWFHGFRDDIWQAYALAVYVADTIAADSLLRPPGRGHASRPGKLEGAS